MAENSELLGNILTGINEIKRDIGRIESKVEINYDETIRLRARVEDHSQSQNVHGWSTPQDKHNRIKDYVSIIFAAGSLCLSFYYAYSVTHGAHHVDSYQADAKK